jgi:hypothetical protein
LRKGRASCDNTVNKPLQITDYDRQQVN